MRALIAILSTLGTFGAAVASGISPDAARDILLRYLERGRTVPMIAIVEQRIGGRGGTMQLKIEQDRLGRMRTTVLQPLSKQGIIKLDDGKRWIEYQPDEARMIVMESPRLRMDDARFRIGLADQNYRLSVEHAAPIAGRSVVVVVAEPKAAEMPIRRYSIDPVKNVLLRLETVRSDEGKRTLLDTKAVSFPASVSGATFELRPVENVVTTTLDPTVVLGSDAQARQMVGFVPIMPRNLPFGFVVRDPETNKSDCRFVAVRITDGLVYATVYQFREDVGGNRPGRGGSHERFVYGLRIRIMGDLPDSVQRRLLDSFAREATGAMGPTLELGASRGALQENVRFDWSLNRSGKVFHFGSGDSAKRI